MAHPLTGKRIVITRPESQANHFAEALRAVGAVPILFPTIQIVPIQEYSSLDQALHHLDRFDWVVFTSVNGVQDVLARLRTLGLSPALLNQAKVAVIGPSTAQALIDNGLSVDLQPSEYVAEALFEALRTQGDLAGRRILLLRAEVARPMLHQALIKAGALVEEIHVYRTVRGQPTDEAFAQVRAGVDVVTFTSPLTATSFCELLPDDADRIARSALAASIGPITAEALDKLKLPFQHRLVAAEYTVSGLLNILSSHFDQLERIINP